MTEVIIAENINISNEENYKYIIEMVDINTLLFNIMNTDTGIHYKLYIKKDSEWYKENMYKFQNDFSQLYQIMNDCIFDSESIFKYDLEEIKDMIKFKIKMKQNTKFFKLELDYKLERYISENGILDDRLNSIEYQLNKLREGTINGNKINELKKDIYDIKSNISRKGNIIKKGNIYKVFNDYNNIIYKGGMINGKREGEGIEFFPSSGQILYQGGFKNGYYHGQGTLYNKSSSLAVIFKSKYQGNFIHGLFDGNIETYHMDSGDGEFIHDSNIIYREGQVIRNIQVESGEVTNYSGEILTSVNQAILDEID